MLNGKVTIILLTGALIKKILLYKMSYFSESDTCIKNKMKVELDLSNYAIKYDLKMELLLIHQIFLKKLI